ncbi:MAG: hypothetical protein K2F69_01575 [Bacteroidaceae bacterium]|nr:hypothetical protein [Bacteroidaceae bacterium]
MATLDDILGKSGGGTTPPKVSAEWVEQQNGNSTHAESPKGSQEWAKQNSGDKMPPSAPAPSPAPPTRQTDTQEGGSPARETSKSLEELYKELNPYTPPTAEELEKEKKRQKREQIFNAIGDGISALSNLFFTSQYAPSMYSKGNNLTERSQVRYDKLMKDREEKNDKYYAGLFRARQADERKSEAEREWQRQLGLDAEKRKQREEDLAHRAERERIADDRYAAEQEYRKGRDKNADDKWQKTFDEGRRRANQAHALAVQKAKDAKTLRQQQIAAAGARGARGKQLGFYNGEGNQVSIYENVWKGSMQQVYDVLAEDLRAAYEADKKNNPRVPRHKTATEKEDFVKQNWHKSPRAASIMLSLSKIDPATMHSEIVEEEEIEDYDPNGGSDDVIDYVPGKQ